MITKDFMGRQRCVIGFARPQCVVWSDLISGEEEGEGNHPLIFFLGIIIACNWRTSSSLIVGSQPVGSIIYLFIHSLTNAFLSIADFKFNLGG